MNTYFRGILTIVNEKDNFAKIVSKLNTYLSTFLSPSTREKMGKLYEVGWVDTKPNLIALHSDAYMVNVNALENEDAYQSLRQLFVLLEKFTGGKPIYKFELEYPENGDDLSNWYIKVHEGRGKNAGKRWFEFRRFIN